MDLARLGIQVDTRDLKSGTSELNKFGVAGEKSGEQVSRGSRAANSALSASAGAAARTGKSFSGLGGNARMLSQQLSQVAQQASVTGNVSQALSVQAADIGLAFGTIGAVVGTIATIALPTAIAAISRLTNEGEDLQGALEGIEAVMNRLDGPFDILTADADELAEKYGTAADRVREFAVAQAELAVAQSKAELQSTILSLDDVIGKYRTAVDAGRSYRTTIQRIESQLGLSMQAARSFEAALDGLAEADTFDEQQAALDNILSLIRSSGIALSALPPELADALQQMLELSNAGDAARQAIQQTGDAATETSAELGGAANSAIDLANSLARGVNEAIALRSALAGIADFGAGIEQKIGVMTARNQALREGANEAAAAEIELMRQKRDEQVENLAASGATIDQIATETQSVNDLISEYEGLLSTNESLRESMKRSGGASSSAASTVDELTTNYENLRAQLDPTYRATREYDKAVLTLTKALDAGMIGQTEFNDLVEAAEKRMEGAEEAASKYGKAVSGIFAEFLTGETDLPGLWDRFKSLGVSAFTDILTESFAPDGDGIRGVMDGLSKAFSGVMGNLGSGNIMGAIGSAMPIIGAVVSAINLIRGFHQSQVVGAGVTGSIGANSQARDFETTQHSWLWGLFTTIEETETANSKLTALLTENAASVRGSVAELVEGMGGAAGDLSSIVHEFKIDTRDMSADEVKEALSSHIEAYSDLVAQAALGSEEFLRAGESYLDALKRMAQALPTVNAALETLGHTMFEVSLVGADAASAVAELFGGVQNFAQSANLVFERFYREGERFDLLMAKLTGDLADMGLEMPKTREEYRLLLESQALMTEKGRENYAALMQMAGSFDVVLPKLRDFTAELSNMGDELGRSLKSAIRSAGQAADEFESLFRTIIDMARDIRASVRGQSAISDNAMDDFRRAYARAMGGDQDAMRSIGRLGEDAVSSFAQVAGSAAEYRLFTSRVANQVQNVAGLAAGLSVMKTIEERTLEEILKLVQSGELTTELLDESIAKIVKMNDSFIAGLGDTNSTFVSSLGGVSSDLVNSLSNLNFETINALYDLNEGFKTAIETGDSPVVDAIWGSTTDLVSELVRVRASVHELAIKQAQAGTSDSEEQDTLASQIAQIQAEGANVADRLSGISIPDKIRIVDSKGVWIGASWAKTSDGQTFREKGYFNTSNELKAVINKARGYVDTQNAKRDQAVSQQTSLQSRLDLLREQIRSMGGTPSFAGGGFTGMGSRSGGLDGQGGFNAMLHPRETVIDHTRHPLHDPELLREMRETRREMAAFREEQRQLGVQSLRHTRKTSQNIDKWDQIGLPQEQT